MSNKLVKNPKKPVYICDADKNRLCPNRKKNGWCGVTCFCTTDSLFAVKPIHKLTYEEYAEEERKREEEFYGK